MAQRLESVVQVVEGSAGPRQTSNHSPDALPLDEVYAELRVLANRCIRGERPGHTLQSTELVHEAYLRFANDPSIRSRGRPFLFAVASKVIRDVLVDHARRRNQRKRGGGWRRVELEPSVPRAERGSPAVDLLDLHAAMLELERSAPRQSRIVEMRFFGGMTTAEIATVLGLSLRTVADDWTAARLWLHQRLCRGLA